MNKQIGDLHLKIVLAGEPATVRSANDERFITCAERATISHHSRLRFARYPHSGSSGIVELDFLEANPEKYQERHQQRLEQEADCKAELPAGLLRDPHELGPTAALAPN